MSSRVALERSGRCIKNLARGVSSQGRKASLGFFGFGFGIEYATGDYGDSEYVRRARAYKTGQSLGAGDYEDFVEKSARPWTTLGRGAVLGLLGGPAYGLGYIAYGATSGILGDVTSSNSIIAATAEDWKGHLSRKLPYITTGTTSSVARQMALISRGALYKGGSTLTNEALIMAGAL